MCPEKPGLMPKLAMMYYWQSQKEGRSGYKKYSYHWLLRNGSGTNTSVRIRPEARCIHPPRELVIVDPRDISIVLCISGLVLEPIDRIAPLTSTSRQLVAFLIGQRDS